MEKETKLLEKFIMYVVKNNDYYDLLRRALHNGKFNNNLYGLFWFYRDNCVNEMGVYGFLDAIENHLGKLKNNQIDHYFDNGNERLYDLFI